MSARVWTIMELAAVIRAPAAEAEVQPGVWWPARPLWVSGPPGRMKAAWLVFTGKADAVLWTPRRQP